MKSEWIEASKDKRRTWTTTEGKWTALIVEMGYRDFSVNVYRTRGGGSSPEYHRLVPTLIGAKRMARAALKTAGLGTAVDQQIREAEFNYPKHTANARKWMKREQRKDGGVS